MASPLTPPYYTTDDSDTNMSDPAKKLGDARPNPLDRPAADHLARLPEPAASTVGADEHADTQHQHIWMITGPAGCGKSTVAKYLADALALPYLEGDNYHSEDNIKKMRESQPLTDQDRWDWLITLRKAALEEIGFGPEKKAADKAAPRGVIVTCSALKARYRDVLRIATYGRPSVRVHFVFLYASEEVLQQRVAARAKATNHYMPASMVASQFASLEMPAEDETDVVRVDVGAPVAQVEEEALAKVRNVVEGLLEKDGS